jgi:hypothetical protein
LSIGNRCHRDLDNRRKLCSRFRSFWYDWRSRHPSTGKRRSGTALRVRAIRLATALQRGQDMGTVLSIAGKLSRQQRTVGAHRVQSSRAP